MMLKLLAPKVDRQIMLTIITTCKNRLSHLQQTLPAMLKQSFSKVIVVDYGCEQGTADWVEKNHPAAKVIKVSDDPNFCAARARNIGASHAESDFLLFIDADTILNVDVGQWLASHVQPETYYVSADRAIHPDLWGFVICDRKSFQAIEGYDEAFNEWGGEDKDLYNRLEVIGQKPGNLPQSLLIPIQHGDEIRQLSNNPLINFDTQNRHILLNRTYRTIKLDLQKILQKNLDITMRKSIRTFLFNGLAQAIEEGKKEMELSLTLPPRTGLQRKLTYIIQI